MAWQLLRQATNIKPLARRCMSSGSASSEVFWNVLNNVPPSEVSAIDNGVRVANKYYANSKITTVGFWINTGSRYEDSSENGAANFIKRLAGKEIEKELFNLPACDIKRVTEREKTFIHATLLNEDVPKFVESFSQALLDPKWTDADVDAERKNILAEQADIENYLKEYTFDNLHRTAFQGTALEQNGMGPTENIKTMSASDLKNYIDQHFKACRFSLIAAGGVKHDELVKLAEKSLGKLDNTFDGEVPTLTPCRYTGSEVRHRDDSIPLGHIAIAVKGPSLNSFDFIPLLVASKVINNYSRWINSSSPIDDMRVLCNEFETINIGYSDTGLFGYYLVCNNLQCEEASESVLREWSRITTRISESEVETAKRILTYDVLKRADGLKSSCEDLGNNLLIRGKNYPLIDQIKDIERISAANVMETMEKYTEDKCEVLAAVGPIEALPNYLWLRSKLQRV